MIYDVDFLVDFSNRINSFLLSRKDMKKLSKHGFKLIAAVFVGKSERDLLSWHGMSC